ncbi:MAG: hypothetical protein AB1Z18_15655 [Desulfobacterales bacterium]
MLVEHVGGFAVYRHGQPPANLFHRRYVRGRRVDVNPFGLLTLTARTGSFLGGVIWFVIKQVVCIACRIGYDLDDVVWVYVGACAPINLNSRIARNHLVIERSRLAKSKRFF